MIKYIGAGIASVITFAFIGCCESEKSYEYYMQNDKEREAKVKECKGKDYNLKENINCKYAGKAAYQKALEDSKNFDDRAAKKAAGY
ncbi:hypothetical protein CQA53_09530 [Helicobacter didelphidarum]|uniref:EexN family lipoprotein n=1 Tax=Helicobacter didelphidarum TaxID=2040648 RepID=A0A3D8IBH9_9HELI|nr:EexN family lipoprotein [Helicobacter didelphidarum]RDU62114.1 hypothetical protein CQA53_09530 [Helicobacter didelphidarum]